MLTQIISNRNASIFFDCPAIWYGGSGIHATSTIFWQNTTLYTIYYTSVQHWKCSYVTFIKMCIHFFGPLCIHLNSGVFCVILVG
jgi:hypothetical protein